MPIDRYLGLMLMEVGGFVKRDNHVRWSTLHWAYRTLRWRGASTLRFLAANSAKMRARSARMLSPLYRVMLLLRAESSHSPHLSSLGLVR